ncbi:MAG: hypothetical protein AB8G95_04305 [Anaerolineae bacterium]
MKKLLVTSLALLTAMLVSVTAFAGTAYDASYTTSITYQNVGTETATIQFSFYNEANGTSIDYSVDALPAGAGSSLFVGSVGTIASGFSGSAVMSSNVPVVATMVQISSDGDVKNRPLSNGFSAGSTKVLLATVLKNTFSTSSRFSIQNADSGAVDLVVSIYNSAAPTAAPTVVNVAGLPEGSAKYFDMGTLAEITAASFNGSAVVEAFQAGTTTPANIVGSVLEMSTNGPKVSAFQGIPVGGTEVFMPSAACKYFGLDSFYAVQNTGTATTSVTVTYSNGQTDVKSIDAGAKASFATCNQQSDNFNGSATITSAEPIIVIGKISNATVSTAFEGATTGGTKLACPYVRWSASQYSTGQRQRAFIAIQNVGSALAAGDVTATYIDKTGTAVGTHTMDALATGAKQSTRATAATGSAANLDEFGYIGGFGGGLIIEGPAGSELVGVVRVQSIGADGQGVGEDYNCIPVSN